jgi:hypothetical protein
MLGRIARNTLHALFRIGSLASVPIERRRFISARAIAAFIAESSAADGPECGLAAAGGGGEGAVTPARNSRDVFTRARIRARGSV